MSVMPMLNVNGRMRFFRRIESLTKLRPGLYEVRTECHGVYHVEGGKKAGGGRRDWFLDSPERLNTKTIRCTSLMDALRCIDGM